MTKTYVGLFLVFLLIMIIKFLKLSFDSKPKKLVLRSVPFRARAHGVAIDGLSSVSVSVPIQNYTVPSVPVSADINSSVPFIAVPSVEVSRYRRAQFLTGSELRFLPALQAAISGRAHVMVKVRLADLAHPVDPQHSSAWHIGFNHIKAKHVDFVICDFSFCPLCVIELDDSSHFQFKRVQRDHMVDQVLQDIGLPIFHIHTRSNYTAADFQALDKILASK